MVAMTKRLLQQNYVCRGKIFFGAQMFCCDKHTFVATEDVFRHNKHMFAVTKLKSKLTATKLLSHQKCLS